jgi:hypothetical protein
VTGRVDIAALEAAYEVAMAGSAVGAHTTAADECVAALPVLLSIARAAERFVGTGIAIQDEGFFQRWGALCDAVAEAELVGTEQP